MNTQIALDPELDLSAEQFAAAWNHSPYSAQYGPAHTQPPTAEIFSPEIAVALITIAVSVPATILTSFITEYLKAKYIPKDKPTPPPPLPAPTIIINQIILPNDQPLFIISPEQKTA
ncbi:MAG: hypothetical protein KA338_17840 [Chloroflexi bacterium]|nr:hypothetical protein [Chloroflexota bacterium]